MYARQQVDYPGGPQSGGGHRHVPPDAPLPEVGDRLERWSTIELAELTFTHLGGHPGSPVLNNVHLRLNTGRLGMVGESGSGKSTLMRALAGLYLRSTSISASMAGRLMTCMISTTSHPHPPRRRDLRRHVPAKLDHGPGLSRPALVAAIKAARPAILIQSLPEGIDTSIVERGANFSGGQKQRIALARGLIRLGVLRALSGSAHLQPRRPDRGLGA